jgi:hypothetical protein
MAIPFRNVSSGSKDDYIFFHFQVHIQVECVFGILVLRCGFLRCAIPCNIPIVRTIALVSCLTRLHNFCIDEIERTKEHNKDALPLDIEHIMNGLEGYVLMVKDCNHGVPTPKDIMDGGNHFYNCPRATRQSRQSDVVTNNK